MDKKPVQRFKKNGSYYRRMKITRERCELFLRSEFAGDEQTSSTVSRLPPEILNSEQVSTIQRMYQAKFIIALTFLYSISTINKIEGPSCSENNQIQTVSTASPKNNDGTVESLPIADDGRRELDLHSLNLMEDQNSNRAENNSREALRKWALEHNISHQALKGLLDVIKLHYGDTSLPSDPRTLLATPKNTSMLIKDIPGGTYWHQGLEVCLRNRFKTISEGASIELNVNMDGLPIHKSSKDQFWPILCNVHEMPHLKPMVVGIFLGKNKPSNASEYLKHLILTFNK